MLIPTGWTDIAEWKRTLRAEIRILKRDKFVLQLRSLRLRLRVLTLRSQILILNLPDYLTALLLAIYGRHRLTPPDRPS